MSVVTPQATGVAPIPAGRGRWRTTLHDRAFAAIVYPADSGIGEITDARSRRLVQTWNKPAQFTFTVDGRSASALNIAELQTDIIAWRWQETADTSGGGFGGVFDVPAFRGIITASEDEISEQAHTVNFTALDYSAMLDRRILTAKYSVTGREQDSIVGDLLNLAKFTNSSSGTSFNPGSYFPLAIRAANPDGTNRTTPSGTTRDRTYLGSQNVGEAISDLAAVIGGFDYDVYPRSDLNGIDNLRIFWPQQGLTKSYPPLVYGENVSSVTRSVSSSSYTNYERVLGNNSSSDPAAAQVFAEYWNGDANNITVTPVGLWMTAEDAADVIVQNTLLEKATGDVNINGLLAPTYTIGLRPGWFTAGIVKMGDVVPLAVQSGRLNVNTTVRIVGITYDIGDDGQEDVTLTVGRPADTLVEMLTKADNTAAALVRR